VGTRLQAASQPAYPLLYGLAGFRYCDLLLAAPERAAWQEMLGSARVPRAGLGVPAETNFPEPSASARTPSACETQRKVRSGEDAEANTRDACAPQIQTCRAVSQRAAQTLKWSTELWNHGLLTLALDHLTLGRAALYEAILSHSDIRVPSSELESAVAGLRRAGTTHHIPHALLTRAWLRFLTGARTGPDSAQEDLDEAWEIAERGPMPLFLADIHLHRARLFGRMKAEGGRIVFPERIRGALGEARVALVVIGPWWLRVSHDPADVRNPRRLDDPADWVRREIETLLARDGVAVIPLLLGGAGVPGAGDLPASLRALPERHAMHLRPYPDFERSLGLVIEAVAKLLQVEPFHRHAPAAVEKPPRVAPTRLSVTGREFLGRGNELHLRDEAWGRSAQDKINLVSLIGQGGEGKTALVLHWSARRARDGWPGARRVFDWSFYSQGSSAQSAAGADEFFARALAWFGHTGDVPRDPWTKGETPAALIAAERTLLVLDGLDPLQEPPGDFGGEFKDPSMKALLRALAMRHPGRCVLTSRTALTDLADFVHADGPCVRHPLHALDADAARGVEGPDQELDEAIAWFRGHA